MRIKAVVILGALAAGIAAVVALLFLAPMRVGDSPALDDGALPRAVRGSNSCDAEPRGTGSASLAEVRTMTVAAWILGAREGAFAGWTKQLRDGGSARSEEGMSDWLAQSQREASRTNASAERLAATLKVQRPAPFGSPGHGTTVDDFRVFVENANQATARGLAEHYSPTVCAVYKMAAYFGFSTLFRAAAPKARNIFAAELKYYGQRLDMPGDLVSLMVEPGSSDLNVGEIIDANEQLSGRVAEHWNKQ